MGAHLGQPLGDPLRIHRQRRAGIIVFQANFTPVECKARDPGLGHVATLGGAETALAHLGPHHVDIERAIGNLVERRGGDDGPVERHQAVGLFIGRKLQPGQDHAAIQRADIHMRITQVRDPAQRRDQQLPPHIGQPVEAEEVI